MMKLMATRASRIIIILMAGCTVDVQMMVLAMDCDKAEFCNRRMFSHLSLTSDARCSRSVS